VAAGGILFVGGEVRIGRDDFQRFRQAKDGAPFCVITLKISSLWTCSLSRP
jgi:hypothetical protein